MSARLFKHLALSASFAVLAFAASAAHAADSAGMPAMPAPTVTKATTAEPAFATKSVTDNHGEKLGDQGQLQSPLTIVNDGKGVGGAAPAQPAKPVVANGKSAAGLPGKVTIADAVSFGVSTNPEYMRNADNRRATDEELRQAKGLYLPSLDFQANAGYALTNNQSTRHDGRGDRTDGLGTGQAGLTLTEMLFDGFSTKYENIRQQARVLSASHRVKEAAELTGVSIIESYLDVLRQRELLTIARQNVNDHLNIMDQIQDSANAGRSTEADNEQARARLASARANEASIRESLRVAEANFIQQVGDPPQDLVMPLVPVDALEKNVEEEVKISLHQSPTIDIYEADVKVAHAEFEKSKANFYPKVDLQLNGRSGDNLNGVRGGDSSASALAVINWNLYRGGIDTANTREQINREAQAKEERSKAARQVENDVRTTWARMVSAGERAKEFATQAAANTETVKAYKDQFDLSRRTLLDVLDAQNELFVSKSNSVNAEFVEMFAVYRLLGLKGELLPTLGVAYPRESDPAKM